MSRFFIFIFLAFAAVSCKKEFTHSDLKNINGYWEIQKVTFEDGTDKEYKISETIDFFEINGKAGLRKKVNPQFDGTYLENGHAEKIEVSVEDGKTFLNYSTAFAKWKEEIIQISKETLILENERNIQYQYKRHTAFSIK